MVVVVICCYLLTGLRFRWFLYDMGPFYSCWAVLHYQNILKTKSCAYNLREKSQNILIFFVCKILFCVFNQTGEIIATTGHEETTVVAEIDYSAIPCKR